jgi:hypothetical protein
MVRYACVLLRYCTTHTSATLCSFCDGGDGGDGQPLHPREIVIAPRYHQRSLLSKHANNVIVVGSFSVCGFNPQSPHTPLCMHVSITHTHTLTQYTLTLCS